MTHVTLFILAGPDTTAVRARTADLLRSCEGAAVSRFDLHEDGGDALAAAATSMSLFGGPRVLLADPVNILSEPCAAALSGALAPDVTVILTGGGVVPVAVRRALPDAVMESFTLPTPRDAGARVSTAAQMAGVSLDRPARELLVRLAPGHWSRVVGALAQLRALGLDTVGADDVRPLLGTAAAQTVPWALTDAMGAGDLPAALRIARTLDPIPTVGYLANRTAQLGLALDSEGGETPAGADARSAALARRIGRPGIGRSWDLVATAASEAKRSTTPGDVLAVLVVRLTRIWAPTVSV